MLTLFANLSSWADIKDLKTTQYRDTSLCSYVLLRACPKMTGALGQPLYYYLYFNNK